MIERETRRDRTLKANRLGRIMAEEVYKKLNETIELQKELHRAQADGRRRQDHQLLCSDCQSGSKQARVNDNCHFRSDTDVEIVRYITLSLFPSGKANDGHVILDLLSN